MMVNYAHPCYLDKSLSLCTLVISVLVSNEVKHRERGDGLAGAAAAINTHTHTTVQAHFLRLAFSRSTVGLPAGAKLCGAHD